MLRTQQGSASVGFVLAAPIGLLLLLTSFEISGLVWRRSLLRHELGEVVQIAARQPSQANNAFQNFISELDSKPVKASLSRIQKGELDLYVGKLEFEKQLIGLTSIKYQVQAIELVEP